jgi:hypothetical protein
VGLLLRPLLLARPFEFFLQLSTLLPPNSLVKTSLTIDTTWAKPQLEAAYNVSLRHGCVISSMDSW